MICDFFKMNHWFSKTNRKMIDEMANHGNRIRRYMDRHGVDEVEAFVDTCLSIEDLIDIHSPFIKRYDKPDGYEFVSRGEKADAETRTGKFRAMHWGGIQFTSQRHPSQSNGRSQKNRNDAYFNWVQVLS